MSDLLVFILVIILAAVVGLFLLDRLGLDAKTSQLIRIVFIAILFVAFLIRVVLPLLHIA